MKRIVLMVAALALLATGCGIESSEVNEIGLVYSGGVVEDKEFEKILEPGSTSNPVGLGSTVYKYPIDQRTWISGQDAPVVTVVVGGQEFKVPYEMYFTLNQSPKVLREFHESLGVKTEAWTAQGWTDMLEQYFGRQLDRAMDTVAQGFDDPKSFYLSDATRLEFQQQVPRKFREQLEQVIGGNYFCGPEHSGPDDNCGNPTITIGKPIPVSDKFRGAIAGEAEARQKAINQEQLNEVIKTELEAVKEQVDVLGPEVYACIQQAEVARQAKQAPPPCFLDGTKPVPTVDAGK